MDGDMSETTAVSLPDDAIFDILSRTPTKSVCRFLCVSKGWRDLISSSAFLAAHKALQTDAFLIDTGNFRGNTGRDLRLMDMDGHVVRVIEGVGGSGMYATTSLDDLVCVSRGLYQGAQVVDPATGEVLLVTPGLEVRRERDAQYSTINHYGSFCIGRATPSGVYKVVRVVLGGTCDVLTLGDDAGWRMDIQTKMIPKHAIDCERSPTAINGVMYFFAAEWAPLSDGSLLCFDLENEKWKDSPIKGPEKMLQLRSSAMYITELNGALCMVQEAYNGRQILTSIWTLEYDSSNKSNSWTKLYTILAPGVEFLYRPLRRVIHNDAEKLLVQCVPSRRQRPSVLQLYDPRTRTITNIAGDFRRSITLCKFHLENLVPVKN